MQPTKKELAQQKRDIVQRVYTAIMHVLTDSQLYGTSLWPKNGFKPGWDTEYNRLGNRKLDVICINVMYNMEMDYHGVRFNLWNASFARAQKQNKQLLLILDNSIYDGIHFIDELQNQENMMCSHHHDDCVMGMMNIRFRILE